MADLTAFADEKLVFLDKPQSLTPSVFAPMDGAAKEAFITVDGNIRYRLTGEDPTDEIGHLLSNGFLVLKGELSIKKFKALNVGASVAILQATYFKE